MDSQLMKAQIITPMEHFIQRGSANYKPNIRKYDLFQSRTTQYTMKAQIITPMEHYIQRGSANYKKNIWKYDLFQSLTTQYTEDKYRQVEKLKEEVVCIFVEVMEPLAKLQLIDSIGQLGLATIFEKEIKEGLDTIFYANNKYIPSIKDDLYATALCFRLLRQYGYNVSQDMFIGFMNEMGNFMESTASNVKAMLELFEASHLGLEGENLLDEAKVFSSQNLKIIISSLDNKDRLKKQLANALELPLQWRVEWYNVRRHIYGYEKDDNMNSTLLKLAKLNFNMVQARHQQDLSDTIRWWRNLGIAEKLRFSRERMVESFLLAVGVTFEPQYERVRKWVAKVIMFIVIIDDIYDEYGSLQELEHFTNAVDMWDSKEVQQLPECMKISFRALCDTIEEIDLEIQKEKGWNSVLPHLQKSWADFCKGLLVEAKWYNEGYIPSLEDYLDNGWLSVSGYLLSFVLLFGVTQEIPDDVHDFLKNNHDLMYNSSMIFRLCNDLATPVEEIQKGKASSSILCYMREANVSEEVAREHTRSIIRKTWKNINKQCASKSPFLQPYMKHVTNIARFAHFIYNKEVDGFSIQDRSTRDHVVSLFIEPIAIN